MTIASVRSNSSNRPAWATSLAIVVFSLLVFWMYGLDLPIRRDNAIYIYAGEQLLHGDPPYVSIVDQKTPFAAFTIALAIFVTQPFTDPVTGTRIVFILMSIATVLVTYQLARRIFPDSALTILAPLAMLGFHGFVLQGAMGGEPRTVLLLCLVSALLLLVEKRWFWAAVFSALAVLTWQPAAPLALAALVYAGLQQRQQRLGALARVVLGGALPTIAMFAYFGAAGALDELLRSAFVLGSYQVRVEQSELVALTKSIWLGFPLASPLVAIGVLAFAVRAASEVRTLKSSQWGSTPLVPLGLILVLFFVWSMIDYQGYPDFFPFLPYAALGIVVAADKFVAWLGARGAKLAGVLAIAALMILPGLNVALANKLSRQSPVWHDGLQKQRRAYAQVVDPARADCRDMCRIVVIGLPEVPALLGFKALSRFILNDWGGTDAFIASGYANGFQGWLDELQAAKPDLVVAKTTEFDNYSAANHRLVMDWLGSRCFEKVAHDDIETKEFRSDHIASWRARPECR